ncbi:MAG: hydrogenase iron-sulfur subunit [Nitrospinota bacterium]
MEYKEHSFRRKIIYIFDEWVDKVFTPKYNPFYWLGTICFFLLILIAVSGIYLFIFYRTSNAYETVQYLTVNQWYLGGIMRSIHRYASDGFILFMFLHLLREFLLGKYRQRRWVSWSSGIALFIVSIILGIMGYWLVWDERAQLIALKTAQLLDDIPIFVEPPPISFLSNATIHKMVFFVILLGHIAITFLGISILVGIHVTRNARPALKAPRAICFTILIVLSLLSIIAPATSAPPADMGKMPINTPFDWFFFFIYPLSSILPKGAFWFTSVGGTLFLFISPWFSRSNKKLQIAHVKSGNCVGCEQCNRDCPYDAIKMIHRKDGRPYLLEAQVIESKCTSCGICIGSCGSKGIYLPDKTLDQIEKEIARLLSLTQKQNGLPVIIGFVCEKSIKPDELPDNDTQGLKEIPDVPIITFPCAGMIHHSLIEYALNSGAEGVFICGCQIKECNYREGSKWLQARLKGVRAPVLTLKGAINYSRVRAYWLSPLRKNELIKEINIFRRGLKYLSNVRHYELIEHISYTEKVNKRTVVFSTVPAIVLSSLLILFLSTKPIYPFYSKDISLIKFTFKHRSKHSGDCKELAKEDTKSKLKHMRKTNSPFAKMRMDCSKRERLPIYVEMDLDNKNILSKSFYPTGLRGDGSTFAYEEIPIKSGIHEVKIKMRDSKKEGPFDYIFEKKIDLKGGMITVFDFDKVNNKFYIMGQNENGE